MSRRIKSVSRPDSPPQIPTQEQMKELHDLDTKLRRFTYHFQNGDRHQMYWRHLKSFQKELSRLLTELRTAQDFESKVQGSGSQSASKARDRVASWTAKKLPQWFQTFHQLIRDYPTKAAFLLASLASVARILQVSGPDGLLAAETVEADRVFQLLRT